MAKCDVCGKDCAVQDMETLLDSYQMPGLRDLCKSCVSFANRRKAVVLSRAVPRLMKRALLRRQAASAPPSSSQEGAVIEDQHDRIMGPLGRFR